MEAGARYRLLRPGLVDGDDVLSLEGSVRSAGACNFAVSANANAAGRDALRASPVFKAFAASL